MRVILPAKLPGPALYIASTPALYMSIHRGPSIGTKILRAWVLKSSIVAPKGWNSNISTSLFRTSHVTWVLIILRASS
ncbi:hypothetical protein FR483_n238R [Paramecium bursaria Chlorella virus FR483]|uniref:Uncharacterized protein n238R n=1 Tax=Paramecium bursaria Chlorella virus FR483 TaxID=399781 RepID=A7J6U2_PBCVF|nr:hypothetical protein FR483_n238R [Paramecium bursaria Chlorella virus FR483]ABT15523.1 hypothetical protein FR483_n238R [Paramecium bursaria Chlorella virus FR483]